MQLVFDFDLLTMSKDDRLSWPDIIGNFCVQVSTKKFYELEVREEDLQPQLLTLKSTLPILCPNSPPSTPCRLTFTILYSQTDIAVRQRYPGIKPLSNRCQYIIADTDWKPENKTAYNVNGPLEVIAQIDPYITMPRLTQLRFSLPSLPMKTVGELTYTNPWSGYSVVPNTLVRILISCLIQR